MGPAQLILVSGIACSGKSTLAKLQYIIMKASLPSEAHKNIKLLSTESLRYIMRNHITVE